MLPSPPTSSLTWQQRLAAFPAELRERRIWCVWKPETRDGKTTKVPLARSNDPSTWVSFQEACTTADSTRDYGVGVLCDGNYSFVDLDKCVTGEIDPWARAVLLRTNSYAELSPSGTGLHIFLKGAVSKAAKVNGCEIYSKTRFFTVTGRHVAGTPLTVAALDTNELEELRQDIADDQLRPKAADAETRTRRIIAERPASHADREAKLDRVLAGDLSDYNDNRSGAVHGVLQLLARKHQGDREAMQEEFEQSPLCALWDDKWTRLCESELSKGVAAWKGNGSPKWDTDDKPQPAWTLQSFAEIEAKPYEWLWPGYLAIGKLTTFNGEPGHGKSLVSVDVAARVTKGADFPDGSTNTVGAGDVLLLTVEEDAADTIKPRFLAAGGDESRLHRLANGGRPVWFAIEESLDRLRKVLQTRPTIRLIVVDPLMDFTKAEQNKDADVRAALNKLVDLAEELGIAVLGINHLNKKSDMAAIHRVSGARGWTAVARLNFLIGKGDDKLRHVCALKVNIAAENAHSLDFKVEERAITSGKIVAKGYPCVLWVGPGSMTAEDLTAVQRPTKTRDTGDVDNWLRGRLADGEWKAAAKIMGDGELEGYSQKQIQRAADRLQVEKQRTKTVPSRVEWRMTPTPSVPSALSASVVNSAEVPF